MCYMVFRRMRISRSSAAGHGNGEPLQKTSSKESSSTATTSATTTEASSSGPFSTSSLSSVQEMLPDRATIFYHRDLAVATENFSSSNLVGGSRSVWKARIRVAGGGAASTVAVSRKGGCVFDGHRLTRILGRIHALHHSSLVRVLGACKHSEYLYLVYEFLDSSSNLRDCLRSKHVSGYSPLFSWHSRLQIAVDVAKGLEYLHHLAPSVVIHKYIHSRNILVSSDRRAKIAHVGLSLLTGELPESLMISEFSKSKMLDSEEDDELSIKYSNTESPRKTGGGESSDESHQKTDRGENPGESQPTTPSGRSSRRSRLSRAPSLKIKGNNGYMPPEYISSGEVTTKYDVFCFGVVLAEILSGKEAISASAPGKGASYLLETLASTVSGHDAKGKLRLWVDPLLKDSYPVDDALKVASIAASCVHSDPAKRPEMLTVVLDLQKLLTSAKKWDAKMAAQREAISSSLQPR